MRTAEETSLAELDRTRASGRLAVTEVTGGTHLTGLRWEAAIQFYLIKVTSLVS